MQSKVLLVSPLKDFVTVTVNSNDLTHGLIQFLPHTFSIQMTLGTWLNLSFALGIKFTL